MKVFEVNPSRSVLWEVTDGPAEWIGTTVRSDLKQEGSVQNPGQAANMLHASLFERERSVTDR